MAGGEGGIIVTNDERIADEARIYRDQGKASFLTNLHTRLGYNWRMSEPHAAIALSQFGRLDEFIAHRQHVADALRRRAERRCRSRRSPSPRRRACNYYKYVAFLPDGVDRAALKQLLREEYGVGLSGEVYDTPLHRQPVFEPWADGPLPGAEELCARHVCLPVSAVMTDDDVGLRHRRARTHWPASGSMYPIQEIKDVVNRRHHRRVRLHRVARRRRPARRRSPRARARPPATAPRRTSNGPQVDVLDAGRADRGRARAPTPSSTSPPWPT